jgi:TalC/MipB family fructose-6-phosphate aldolase
MINFFVDSAERTVVEPLLRSGLIAGVTTNPTLLRTAGVRNEDIPGFVKWAVNAGAGTVFVQAWGATDDELEWRGRQLGALGDRVVVKIPATLAGLRASRRLVADGVPVLVTAVYAAHQVLPVIAVGARFIAPYLGRMNDAGRDGVAEIAAMQRAIGSTGSSLRILVASVRDPVAATRLAAVGIRDFTLGENVFRQFFADPLTADAVALFERVVAEG